MEQKRGFLFVVLALLLMILPTGGTAPAVTAQPPGPPSRGEERLSVDALSINAPNLPEQLLGEAQLADVNVTWFSCGSCPEVPEIVVSGSTLRLGQADRVEAAEQAISVHGASAQLPSASKYTISFTYDLYTWDSYNPMDYQGKGYWDLFSISVAAQPYWDLNLSDPVTAAVLPGLGFKYGGTSWGSGIRYHTSGSSTIEMTGNPSGNNYLNVVLDTRSTPHFDENYPSWGTVTIQSIQADSSNVNGSAAANLARSVVGGKYLWGGQGWDWNSKTFVEPAQIFSGYNYYKYDQVAKKGTIVFDRGLDCSGLVLWAHNKAAGATSRFGGPIKVEGADAIYWHNSRAITEAELQPGDLLFFDNVPKNGSMDHVAMYVGGNDPSKNIVEAANQTAGIVYSALATRKAAGAFVGYRRVNSSAPAGVKIQSGSPITLVVKDPGGNYIDANTLIPSTQEMLRQVPGVLYYGVDENMDDYIWAPNLKNGQYIVKVMPKPGAQLTDTYSLSFDAAATHITLAEDVPIGNIPDPRVGYVILAKNTEVFPIPVQYFYLPTLRR